MESQIWCLLATGNDHYGSACVTHDILAHAAQHRPLHGAQTSAADDDGVCVLRGGDLADGFTCVLRRLAAHFISQLKKYSGCRISGFTRKQPCLQQIASL